VVLTHVKPDGDAVGSSLALVRALNTPAPWAAPDRAQAWYFGPPPPWLRAIAGTTPIRLIDKEGIPEVDGLDAVMVVDTGSWSQLEAVHEWLAPKRAITGLVDHHMQGDPEVAAMRHIATDSAAACQPVAELCRLILGAASLSGLPKNVAEPLYLGLATDTGWFRHSNVSRAVMTTAGDLLEAGADHVNLYQKTEQQETLSRLKLLGRALASLELHDEDRLAVMMLTKKDFAACSAQPGESGGFVDYSQTIPTVLVTCLLSEALPGDYGKSAAGEAANTGPLTKVSLRSKPGENAVDVNIVAKALGGGGHIRAAGARAALTLEQTRAVVVKQVGLQTHSL